MDLRDSFSAHLSIVRSCCKQEHPITFTTEMWPIPEGTRGLWGGVGILGRVRAFGKQCPFISESKVMSAVYAEDVPHVSRLDLGKKT